MSAEQKRAPDEILEEALDIASADLPAFLETACGGDRRITVMNEANDLATDTIPVGGLAHLDASDIDQRGADLLGRVAAPPNKESTSDVFYFWVERGKLVERGQISVELVLGEAGPEERSAEDAPPELRLRAPLGKTGQLVEEEVQQDEHGVHHEVPGRPRDHAHELRRDAVYAGPSAFKSLS